MSWKWSESHTQFAPDDGGGGAPEPASNITETGKESAPEPSPAEPSVDAAPAEPDEPPDVEFPDELKSVFIPRSPEQTHPGGRVTQTPTPVQSAPAPTGPQKPPTAEMWQIEPEKAAAMQQAYLEHKIEEGVKRAMQPAEEIRSTMESQKQAQFQSAASKASEALPNHYKNIFNRDKDFRTNPDLQNITKQIIGNFTANALNTGNVDDLTFITSPSFARRALAMAKAEFEEYKAYSVTPGGPMPVGQQGVKPSQEPLLDDETMKGLKEAQEWAGRQYTPQQIAEARKRRDESDW